MSSGRVDEKEILCVICPNSCRMKVWKDSEGGEIKIEGNKCPRGKDYGIQEYKNPTRMLITTMRIIGGPHPVIPVHSAGAIPKSMIFNAVQMVNDTVCRAPVEMDDVLIEDILETGIPVVASRDMKSEKESKEEMGELEQDIQQILVQNFLNGKDVLSPEEEELLEKTRIEIINKLHQCYPNF